MRAKESPGEGRCSLLQGTRFRTVLLCGGKKKMKSLICRVFVLLYQVQLRWTISSLNAHGGARLTRQRQGCREEVGGDSRERAALAHGGRPSLRQTS